MLAQKILNAIANVPGQVGDLMTDITIKKFVSQTYVAESGDVNKVTNDKTGKAVADKFTDTEIEQLGIKTTDIKLSVIMTSGTDLIDQKDKVVFLMKEYDIIKSIPQIVGNQVGFYTLMLRG